MPGQIAFGIGCFHFGYRKPIPYTFTAAEYVKDLDKALRALSSVSEIKIDFDESSRQPLLVKDEVPRLMDGYFFPGVNFLEVQFSVFIPARVQCELFPDENGSPLTETEKFSVVVNHKFHGPIAFVQCLDAGPECNPSSAVRVLREYLKREFSKLDSPVTFEYLGPSPFHANFFAQQSDKPQNSLTLEEIKQHGYNDLKFTYGSNIDADDAINLIYYELSHEIDCFYEIQRASVILMRSGNELIATWHDLRVRMAAKRSPWNISSKIRTHAEVQRLISDLYGFQANLAVELTRLRQDINSIYSKGVDTYLEKFLRARLERTPDYPIDSVLSWAEHTKESSFKQAEIAAVVVSALAGGVVGSLVTVLLQSTQQ